MDSFSKPIVNITNKTKSWVLAYILNNQRFYPYLHEQAYYPQQANVMF